MLSDTNMLLKVSSRLSRGELTEAAEDIKVNREETQVSLKDLWFSSV